MFGKKKADSPAAPPAAVRVRIITPEVVIAGTVAEGIGFVTIPVGEDSVGSWASLDLLDVTITGREGPGVRERVPVFHARGDRIIALLVEAGADAPPLRQWGRYEHPAAGVFHLGPVKVDGTMMRLNPQVIGHVMPVLGGTLTAGEPGHGSRDTPFGLALVNTRWLTGYEPRSTP
jgi:hypothetical protein